MLFYPSYKPTVMAIHGSASTSHQWRALAQDLADDVTFIAPDLPGYGAARHDMTPRLDALATAVRSRTAHIHLLAHSFGGAVALKFANSRPDRIASVTIYDPVVPTGDVWGRPGLPPELAAIWNGFRDAADCDLMRAFLTFWGGEPAWRALDKDQRERLIAKTPGLRRDMEEVAQGLWSLDAPDYCGPLTILRGENSPAVTLGMARAIAAKYRQTIIKRAVSLGHFAPVTQPTAVNSSFILALCAAGADLNPKPNPARKIAA